MVGGVGQSPNLHAVVLATTDGGTSWQARHTTQRAAGVVLEDLLPNTQHRLRVDRIILNGPSRYLADHRRRPDLGTSRSSADLEPVQAIGFATPSLGWIGGVDHSQPTRRPTVARPGTWRRAFGENLNRVRMLGTDLGYAVGETVYKYTAETREWPIWRRRSSRS